MADRLAYGNNMGDKLKAFVTSPGFTHTCAALAPVLATLLAAAVSNYPVLGSVVRAVCRE